MRTRISIAFGILLALSAGSIAAQDANAILTAAAKTIGADNVRTIQYSGSGFTFVFAQAATPGGPWPRFSMKTYTREIDFGAPASHVQLVRTSIDKRGGGGTGLPLVDQMQNQFILPNAPWVQQVDMWITPVGFLKAAMKHNATVKRQKANGKNYNVVSFMDTKYTVRGYIDDQNLIDRVETWIEHPSAGDLLIEGDYSGYKDFGG